MPAKRAPHTFTPAQRPVDVVVLGGGVGGLAVAWRARSRGLSVCVLDRGDSGAATSRVAAGMLAPVTEADAGERALLALGLDGARRWPAFADELREATGVDVGYRRCGTLVVARDRDEAEALDRELALRRAPGAARPSGCCRRPRGARSPLSRPPSAWPSTSPDDHAVDPRLLTAALARAAERAGVVLRPGAEVARVAHDGARVQGVELRGGERIGRRPGRRRRRAAGRGGAGPARRRAASRSGRSRARRCGCGDPGGPGLLGASVRFDGGYLVPRGDGASCSGATVEERGFDTSVTAWAVHELLRDAAESCPASMRARGRGAAGRPAAGHARQRADRSARARRWRACAGPPGTTATAS